MSYTCRMLSDVRLVFSKYCQQKINSAGMRLFAIPYISYEKIPTYPNFDGIKCNMDYITLKISGDFKRTSGSLPMSNH